MIGTSVMKELKLLYMPMVLHKIIVGKNVMNEKTKIHNYPHELSAKHICQSSFPQKTIATWKKKR